MFAIGLHLYVQQRKSRHDCISLEHSSLMSNYLNCNIMPVRCTLSVINVRTVVTSPVETMSYCSRIQWYLSSKGQHTTARLVRHITTIVISITDVSWAKASRRVITRQEARSTCCNQEYELQLLINIERNIHNSKSEKSSIHKGHDNAD